MQTILDFRRNRSNEIPYKGRYTWILERLEKGIETWARYPCGLTESQTQDLRSYNEEFWGPYQHAMKAYGRKMKILLRKGWNGPHHISGQFKLTGKLFEMS